MFGRLTYPALQPQIDKGNRFTGNYGIAAARNQAFNFTSQTGPGRIFTNETDAAMQGCKNLSQVIHLPPFFLLFF
jgi:hypothetical protein